MQRKEKLTVIDLFAGCGGLSLGLEQAGFEPIYVNELNDDARLTYLKNRLARYPKLQKYSSKDIKETVLSPTFFDDLLDGFRREKCLVKGEVDLVVGGPPCQGFSGIGIRRSYAVDKIQLPSNHLYQDMAFFIHQVRPKAFIFENVEGLLRARWSASGSKGEIFQDVLSTFRSIPGYQIKWKLVHASEYGVPQNRPRVLLVGFREDIFIGGDQEDAVDGGFLPREAGGYPDLIDVLGDIVDPRFMYGGSTVTYPKSPRSDFQLYLRRSPSGVVMGRGAALTEHDYSNHSPLIRQKFAFMIANGGKIQAKHQTKKFAQRVLPKRWGNSSPSITVCSLPDDFVHFEQARSLTVREWARMQTFPDWYQFAGNRTTGGIRRAGNPRENIFDREVPKYTQIGNAVPVLLGVALGKHIQKIILKSI